MRLTLVFAWLIAVVLVPLHAYADDVGDSERRAGTVFVPELHGAVSGQLYVADSFGLGSNAIESPPSLMAGVAAGYRHFFDVHGALNLLARIRYAQSTADASEAGSVWELGGDLGLFVRGYSDYFSYAGLGVMVGAELLSWDQIPQDAANHFMHGDTQGLGYTFGAGLETHVGLLWFLAPYLFGEIGAELSVERMSIGDLDATGVCGRWMLRIEWGQRAGSPPGGPTDKLFRVMR